MEGTRRMEEKLKLSTTGVVFFVHKIKARTLAERYTE